MLDATAKIPAGLLNANINWLGSYKLCNDVKHVIDNNTEPITGRYCNVIIGFPISQYAENLPLPNDFGLNVGMCFANSCGNDEVKSIMSNCNYF